jgi:hypothetical protein
VFLSISYFEDQGGHHCQNVRFHEKPLFKGRASLVLQWHDPDTGRRKSKSAGTSDPDKAEDLRADLESDLNNGRYQEAARMTWEHFRELFEEEYVAPLRPGTHKVYGNVFNLFERLCHPRQLRAINERTIHFTWQHGVRPPGATVPEEVSPERERVSEEGGFFGLLFNGSG